MEASCAPSMRANATRLPPESTTATFNGASRGGIPLFEDGKLIGAIGWLWRHWVSGRGGVLGRCGYDQQIAAICTFRSDHEPIGLQA
jgi:hypothetical protein